MAEDINIDTEWKMRHLDIQIALVHLHKTRLAFAPTGKENAPFIFLFFVFVASGNTG